MQTKVLSPTLRALYYLISYIFFPHQDILNSRPEGDSKVNKLRTQLESLCKQEDFEKSWKEAAQVLVRDTENGWRTALQAAEAALNKAEAQALLDKDLGAFKTHNESFQSWIKDQNEKLASVGGHVQVEEKLHVTQVSLNSMWLRLLNLFFSEFELCSSIV